MKHTEFLVLGAGISGITAAHFLPPQSIVLEKQAIPGGLSTQYASGPYWFDYGGHYFHFQNAPAIRTLLSKVTAFQEYQRRSRVFLMNRLIPFPLQDHIAFLPIKLRKRIRDEITWNQPSPSIRMDLHLRAHFGDTLFNLFFAPFMTKYYGQDLANLAVGLEQGSIPLPDKQNLLSDRRKLKAKQSGYNPVFFYPRNGLRAFWNRYSKEANAKVILGEKVISIDMETHRLETERHTYSFNTLISSIPLSEFLSKTRGLPDFSVQRSRLRHTSTRVVNVILEVRRRRFHWVYLPEKETPFYRVGYYPEKGFCSAYLEQTIPSDRISANNGPDPEIATTLNRLGMIKGPEEIRHVSIREIPISYVLHDHAWKTTVPPLLSMLREKGVFSIGRYGAWTYSSMAQDALTARDTTLQIIRERG